MAKKQARDTAGRFVPKYHEPFKPGNMLELVHGANSERVIAARAEAVKTELLPRLLKIAPDLANPRYDETVELYSRVKARDLLLHEHIERVSAAKGPGDVPQRLWEQATANSRMLHELAMRLGLDPASHAQNAVLRVEALEAEARVKLEEAQAELVATTIFGILSDLGMANDPRAPAVVRKHMAVLDGGDAADDATDAEVVEP